MPTAESGSQSQLVGLEGIWGADAAGFPAGPMSKGREGGLVADALLPDEPQVCRAPCTGKAGEEGVMWQRPRDPMRSC